MCAELSWGPIELSRSTDHCNNTMLFIFVPVTSSFESLPPVLLKTATTVTKTVKAVTGDTFSEVPPSHLKTFSLMLHSQLKQL